MVPCQHAVCVLVRGWVLRADSWPSEFREEETQQITPSRYENLQSCGGDRLRLECSLVRHIPAYARGLTARAAKTNRRAANTNSERMVCSTTDQHSSSTKSQTWVMRQ